MSAAYIAVVHKDPASAYGVRFPDIPGVFSAADEIDSLVANAAEALALYVEDATLPDPRSIDEIRKDPEVIADMAEGAFLIVVELGLKRGRRTRAPFRQVDISRAVRGVLATGVGVSRVEIGADGTIVIFASSPVSTRQAERDELDRELQEWRKTMVMIDRGATGTKK